MITAHLLDQPCFTRRKLDVDEYHRMGEAGILHEDDRVELIEGALVEMAPIGGGHTGAVINLTHLLVAAVGRRAFVSVQNSVRLNRHNEPQPDFAILRPRNDRYQGRVPEVGDVLLLVEVARSSLSYDRSVKLPLYAKHGVPEVWIVNIADKLVEVCRDPDPNGYGAIFPAGSGALLEPVLLPGVFIEVADIPMG